MSSQKRVLLGIDVGSTTAKAVLVEADGDLHQAIASAYRRHDAKIREAVLEVVRETTAGFGDLPLTLVITGSAGLGISERLQLPFVQELHSVCALAASRYPDVRALIDIGGEDAKLVFFEPDGRYDARMNGSCAGGTGAFLDQMAALLSVTTAELETLAASGTQQHAVASRCGVFAKTDVQNLLAQGIPRADVALSVFHALAVQLPAALARGRTLEPPVLVTGGPLTFLPTLRRALAEKLGIGLEQLVVPPRGELACAEGAALAALEHGKTFTAPELIRRLALTGDGAPLRQGEPPLFASAQERDEWMARRFWQVPRGDPSQAQGDLFLGIDSGSTTTKLVLIDGGGRLLCEQYEMNHGDPLEAARRGLAALRSHVPGRVVLQGAAVTGYGEELLKAALQLEQGVVETAAHLRAAQAFAPDVSFVLDIGGQDMKALFVRDGEVDRVEVNEACSSGCGSFIQTFAETLQRSVADFAQGACHSPSPRLLGSRCTVFMNSMVKQALKEGAAVDDISAGLAYSVVRNCLYKVLKLRDLTPLGDGIVVQGGTFLNPAVHRAFEVLTQKKVICPDISGLAGAYGAALWARDLTRVEPSTPRTLDSLCGFRVKHRAQTRCQGCENRCPLTVVTFEGGGKHVSGNRCERVHRNTRRGHARGVNHLDAELKLLLERPLLPPGPAKLRLGLPMALGMYESLPFWAALFTHLGHAVVLSGKTHARMVQDAADTCSSDSICLPAKVASAHVVVLGKEGVDRIFYPQVFYETPQEGALSGFNCPIVAGYPEGVAAAVDPQKRHGVRMTAPPISFKDREALRRTVKRALVEAEIPMAAFERAFAAAVAAQEAFVQQRRELGQRALEQARASGRRLMMLACRPYHLDAYLHHGLPEMVADMGHDVVSCQCLPDEDLELDATEVLPQWSYPNRVLQAAKWIAGKKGVELLQLNSFGCGPDAIVSDETAAILEARGKRHALLRIDEASGPGSLRLRLRTLELRSRTPPVRKVRRTTKVFQPEDRHRTLVTVPLDALLSRALAPEFERLGYRLEVVPPTDRESLEKGLQYVNNEICYPAILTIGDLIKAVESGRYRRDEIALALTQTGGPCRASNYVPLLKKALVAAGYADVPVVTLQTAGEELNEQPGFTYDRLKLFGMGLHTVVVTDALSMMARALGPREVHKGEAWSIAERLVDEWEALTPRGRDAAFEFLSYAARTLAKVPVARTQVPRVGIVGEIYVKYSPFANRGLIDWLTAQGIEPVVPPLISFFVQEPLNVTIHRQVGFDDRRVMPWIFRLVDQQLTHYLDEVNARLHDFPFDVHFPTPRQLAAKAHRILSLAHQYGEGWVLGGEVLDMADRGITNVVCLQPFGCIANQVVAKSIERRLRQERPGLNLLYLDLDHNTSEANLFNRLKLLISPPSRRPTSVACKAPKSQVK